MSKKQQKNDSIDNIIENTFNHIKDIVDAANKAGKIVVATGDVHYLNPEDKIYRDVYITAKSIGNGRHPLYDYRRRVKNNPEQHFRTTNEMMEEFIGATGMTLNSLTVYRNHPLDNIHYLVENKIPVILVAGDSDGTVPYDENGIFVKEAYEKAGLPIKVIVKPGCDHHPHGLEDPTEIVEFIEANY